MMYSCFRNDNSSNQISYIYLYINRKEGHETKKMNNNYEKMFIIKGLIISLMMIVPVLCFLTLYNLIVNSLLTGDDDVKLFFACLEPLWHWLDPSIPVQHV